MALSPHEDSAALHNRFQGLADAARPWRGVIYRCTTPRYAKSSDLLTGRGSSIAGGRWNPPGISTNYGSLTPQGSIDEVLAHFRRYSLPPAHAMPRVIIAVEVVLRTVLDLTDGRARQRLGVSKRRMIEEDWLGAMNSQREALTQAIGRVGFEAGVSALVVPSAARRGSVNLVWFPGNLTQRDRQAIINEEQLRELG